VYILPKYISPNIDLEINYIVEDSFFFIDYTTSKKPNSYQSNLWDISSSISVTFLYLIIITLCNFRDKSCMSLVVRK
jgi:hypothetical protein